MPSTHQSTVRPGDRWDGLTLNITRSGITWASAVWVVQLRRHARGPVLLTITPTVTIDGTTATLAFHIAGSDTRKLEGSTTYVGEVSVSVPAGGGGEPTFGPYTLFTWDLETADLPQPPAVGYDIVWSATEANFNITLAEGSTVSVGSGLVIPAGADLTMHSSGRWYGYVASTAKYHRIQFEMIDGSVAMSIDQTPLSSPA